MVQAVAKALGAFCLLFLAACFAVIADHRDLAMYLLVAGSCSGVAAVALFLIGELNFRETRDALGRRLSAGDGLIKRNVANAMDYGIWLRQYLDWVRGTENYLKQELSPAHAARFMFTPKVNTITIDQKFNAEHEGSLHNLRQFTSNLAEIIDRYLSVRG